MLRNTNEKVQHHNFTDISTTPPLVFEFEEVLYPTVEQTIWNQTAISIVIAFISNNETKIINMGPNDNDFRQRKMNTL